MLNIRELLELSTKRLFTSTESSDQRGHNLVSTYHHTEWSELLSPPISYFSFSSAISLPVSISLVLELKACDSLVLGLKVWVTIIWLWLSLRLDQYIRVQSSHEFSNICKSLPSGSGIKGMCLYCLSTMANKWLTLHSDLLESFICYCTKISPLSTILIGLANIPTATLVTKMI